MDAHEQASYNIIETHTKRTNYSAKKIYTKTNSNTIIDYVIKFKIFAVYTKTR